MLRHLARLTRPVPAAGPGALAFAVYAVPRGSSWILIPAADSGWEGVACVDDAARGVLLMLRVWRCYQLAWARRWAEGLLTFLGYMQDTDGRFTNFLLDWDGRRNSAGATSASGGPHWTARAMHALAYASRVLGDTRAAERFWCGLPWLDQPLHYRDVQAVQMLAALEMYAASGDVGLRQRILAWAEQVAACRDGDVLLDAPGRESIHLWGHLQEGALARAGAALDMHDLVEVARRSAEAAIAPVVASGFNEQTVLPFDVSSAVFNLTSLAQVTGASRYSILADTGRAWFAGRNPARQPVYDVARGVVYDGVDESSVSPNAGAESNLEGALALFDKLPWARLGRHVPAQFKEPDR